MPNSSSDGYFRPAHRSATLNLSGFSLVELLVVSAIGGILIAAAASISVTHIRSSANQLSIQQRRSDWGKLTYLLQTETGEGISVATGVSTSGCAATVNSLFTITVPIFDSSSPSTAVPTRLIHYYTTGAGTAAQLWRCGPAILDGSAANTRAGQLSPTGSIVTSLLMEGVPITATLVDSRSLTIQPDTVIAGSVEPFTVRTKVRLIQ
ncbi:prepilin-type N-terminal cleavage/methylation domain-containing protein [Synechococcus sp. CS-1328]|uniref:prepilin-type N-terminal cleavage/methylation domain-containing protein n=1 Tax=Synechococcus sp. CS-1328 TaxID=2847976 RepID=UPI00223A713C|nr:prepilin-type N-terminal cleavage/methylation domain-containing protein [Synechococcus sp. CS-1328]MCT0224855.1 prepilin-type N-terminal cleavage/methylation domain-containing protein [Synechococcus sp. CS-1328]